MNNHRIHRVAKLTGLSKDVIRVWEKRYGLVQPVRGDNRYRHYSDDDIALLRYVKGEIDRGHSIGTLAQQGRDDLLAAARATAAPPVTAHSNPYARLVDELLAALHPLDKTTFERRLNGAVAIIPFDEALHGILLPLQVAIGQRWHDGVVSVAVEHYVTNIIRQKLFSVMNQLPITDQGPKVIVACPSHDPHEVGAQAAAYHCAAHGCRVLYLGANTPMPELAKLCGEFQPELVLLSLTLPLSEAEATAFVEELTRTVTPRYRTIVGGSGATAMRDKLEANGVTLMEDFAALDRLLRSLIPVRARL